MIDFDTLFLWTFLAYIGIGILYTLYINFWITVTEFYDAIKSRDLGQFAMCLLLLFVFVPFTALFWPLTARMIWYENKALHGKGSFF